MSRATWKHADDGWRGEGFGCEVSLRKLGPGRWVLVVEGVEFPLASKRPTFDYAERVLAQVQADIAARKQQAVAP